MSFRPGIAVVFIAAIAATDAALAAPAMHKCDPVDPVADVGWSVVPSLETVGVADGAPFQDGAPGNWFVERTTTLLPFCNYYNEIGIYSMRSYTLASRELKERVAICRATAGGSAPVPPYAGPCPPK